MVDVAEEPGPRDRGDIISGWLLQLVVFLAVLAFVGHEVIAVIATTFTLDETAREVAGAARDEYRVSRSIAVASATAVQTAEARDARVIRVAEEAGELVVEVERDAPTLVIHRIGFLEDLTQVNASSRVVWAS